jgi:hypothetical protein
MHSIEAAKVTQPRNVEPNYAAQVRGIRKTFEPITGRMHGYTLIPVRAIDLR